MAYSITSIKQCTPQPGYRYLFDANVWLAVLDTVFQSQYSSEYEQFFDDVYNSRLTPNATIVLPSLLLSEVLNRLMNDIYYKEFERKNPIQPGQSKSNHYKKVYRVSQDYGNDFAMACASIRAYHQNVTLLSDNLDTFSFKELTKNIPVNLDFNDHLYCRLAQKLGLVIVTNDSDFAVENIPIITSHPKLLRLH